MPDYFDIQKKFADKYYVRKTDRPYRMKRPRGIGFVTPRQEAWLFINKPEVAEAMLRFYGHAPGYWEWRERFFKKKMRRERRSKLFDTFVQLLKVSKENNNV